MDTHRFSVWLVTTNSEGGGSAVVVQLERHDEVDMFLLTCRHCLPKDLNDGLELNVYGPNDMLNGPSLSGTLVEQGDWGEEEDQPRIDEDWALVKVNDSVAFQSRAYAIAAYGTRHTNLHVVGYEKGDVTKDSPLKPYVTDRFSADKDKTCGLFDPIFWN